MVRAIGKYLLRRSNFLEGTRELFLFDQHPRRHQQNSRANFLVVIARHAAVENLRSFPVTPNAGQYVRLGPEVWQRPVECFVVPAERSQGEATAHNRMIEGWSDGQCSRIRFERFLRHAVRKIPLTQTVPGIRLAW